ncbi:hypothetical protein ACQ4PT_012897 [Festuca glaucescens]
MEAEAALDFDLDHIIRRLLAAEDPPSSSSAPPPLTPVEIRHLCSAAKELLLSQPTLLTVPAPVNVCGDIHGQYPDLLRLFRATGAPSADNRYLFLGDYVDRGKQSVETICLLLAYKLKYPDSFFLLRGNHEVEAVNEIFGFSDECKRRRLVRLDQIRPLAVVPESGLACDLLWSDPAEDDGHQGWGKPRRRKSFTFGADVVAGFCERHGLDMVCRAHEMKKAGCDDQFAKGKLVTVFSAPNYVGSCGNDGAVMAVGEDLACSFHVLKPTPTPPPSVMY